MGHPVGTALTCHLKTLIGATLWQFLCCQVSRLVSQCRDPSQWTSSIRVLLSSRQVEIVQTPSKSMNKVVVSRSDGLVWQNEDGHEREALGADGSASEKAVKQAPVQYCIYLWCDSATLQLVKFRRTTPRCPTSYCRDGTSTKLASLGRILR